MKDYSGKKQRENENICKKTIVEFYNALTSDFAYEYKQQTTHIYK